MPVRTRIILVVAGAIVLTLLWFLFWWRPHASQARALNQQADAARAQRTQLEARLEHLKQLQRDEPRLRADLAKLDDALPVEPRLPDFILQMQEAANLSAVPFLSITPGAPTASAAAAAGAGPLQSISLSISTTGKYFELEDFIVRLERLPRALRVNNFALAPGATTGAQAVGGSPTISVSFSMVMFESATAAPAGGAALPAATPVPTPLPPGVTPSPVPVATPIPTPVR